MTLTPDVGLLASDTGPRETLARYGSYAQAQRAVDFLSDSRFPVEHLTIVGCDLRLVEDVTGRLTTGRAALAGAASGAWFGLFIGLLVGLFTTGPAWLGLVLGGLLFGAAWGAVFGAVAHAATGGLRDFSSVRRLSAGQYEVTVSATHAAAAREVLARLT